MTKQQCRRYVAIGDSSTEGIYDPDGSGGYRGWANRLAERIAREPRARSSTLTLQSGAAAPAGSAKSSSTGLSPCAPTSPPSSAAPTTS